MMIVSVEIFSLFAARVLPIGEPRHGSMLPPVLVAGVTRRTRGADR